MSNEDIAGGLKSALARGESLEQAMTTFYNAGYSKEDIEWAAKSLQMIREPVMQPRQMQAKISMPKPAAQEISKYEQKPGIPVGKAGIIILMVLLFFLLSTIISLIFFREKLIDFFNSFF
jgi:hypothetical protein